MILGLTPFTFAHVLISLVGIAAGLIVIFAMLKSERASGWTVVFLALTALTSFTGFLFPVILPHTPAFMLGVISSVVLIVTIAARYIFEMKGAWRWLYVIGAVLAQYLNSFVLVVQAFLKIPPLHALAPQAPAVPAPPFAIAQIAVLLFYVVLGVLALRRFHPA